MQSKGYRPGVVPPDESMTPITHTKGPIDTMLQDLNTIVDHAGTHPKVVREIAYSLQSQLTAIDHRLEAFEGLLEACKEAAITISARCKLLNIEIDSSPTIIQLLDAIAKAEGRETT